MNETQTFKFQLGRVVMTSTAEEAFAGKANAMDVSASMSELLARHRRGDWGDVDPQDAKANDEAVETGDRILSVYRIHGVRLYVITDGETDACPACTAGIGTCERDKGWWAGGIHFRDDEPKRRLTTTIMLPSDY